MRSIRQLVYVLIAIATLATPSKADTISKTVTLADMKVNYKVILPKDYDASRAYHVVNGDALGNGHDNRKAGIRRFHNGVCCKRRGHKNDRGGCLRGRGGFAH